MSDEFDREKIKHGFDLIRGGIVAAFEVMVTNKEAGMKIFRVQLRDQVANSLCILIAGRFPETWPSPLLILLTVPQMRERQTELQFDMPLLRIGFELMDLYDGSVADVWQWSLFHQRLKEFETLLLGHAR